MIVRVKRQDDANSAPYWQSFSLETGKNETVAQVLEKLNYTDDLFDICGNHARRIRWECSCMQKVCGACAMVINGVPALACNTFLRDLKGEELVLEPLSKFPTISDLIVDRSIIMDNLKKAEMYVGEFGKADPKHYEDLYQIAKCLKCGLCLEVCPNYVKGENFFGALFANDSYFMFENSADRKTEIKKSFGEHFAKGCSKSLSCSDICPMNLPTLSSISRMMR